MNFRKLFSPAKSEPVIDKSSLRPSQKVTRSGLADRFGTARQLESQFRFHSSEIGTERFRIELYRFLTRQVPLISAVIWTWSRLVAANGMFTADANSSEAARKQVEARLHRLSERIWMIDRNRPGSLSEFLTTLATGLFRDGLFAGFVTVTPDGQFIDRFIPVNVAAMGLEQADGRHRLYLDTDSGKLSLDRPDFYWLPLDAGPEARYGRSILQAVPFVSYIEQQLVDDMRRASHNAGYHRLHVKITPPERQSGESDTNYIGRINRYFDDTVDLIRSCKVDENPVTWDNVTIEHIGPTNTRSVINSWFLHHRAMIEEICAGTNLAPFLMGYSYGATNTWSAFKFDLVMRQVRAVQGTIASFMQWLGNIDLALAGLEPCCRFVFDNTFTYQASERTEIEQRRLDTVLRLYEAGLISKDEARTRLDRSR